MVILFSPVSVVRRVTESMMSSIKRVQRAHEPNSPFTSVLRFESQIFFQRSAFMRMAWCRIPCSHKVVLRGLWESRIR